MATATLSWNPWHKVVELREDLKSGELAMNQFAADLYEVLMQRGKNPIYENIDSFFALTFPAANLRKLAGDVIQRLAGKNDKAIHQLALTYGGGKTHTLITLAHLVRNPGMLPDTPAVGEFKAAAGCTIPQARVAALCFDKIDAEDGLEVCSPSGQVRRFKYPWSILAWQIAGEKGIEALNLERPSEERETPPAEEPLSRLLEPAMRENMPLLILMDEVLMYAFTVVSHSEKWRSYLLNFFQALTQAVPKTPRCCLVASLLSSKTEQNTPFGLTLETDISNIFGRQQQGAVVSVTRDEMSEILRRRFFTPESVRDPSIFREHVQKALNNIASVDEYTRNHMAAQEELYGKCYPFHPELTDVFYAKWNSLPTFQRTRGLLRTFALALRDAVSWDTSPLIGPEVFLPGPGENGLPSATQELVTVADRAVNTSSAWGSILNTEMARAIEADAAYGLRNREIEQAVITVFLHSQPIGMDCQVSKLWQMITMGKPQKIDLEKGLRHWADTSFWLDDHLTGVTGMPEKWKLGNKPNLNQMHDSQKKLLSQADKAVRLLDQVKKESSLVAGVDPGVVIHRLPQSPADVSDDGKFHYVVLPPEGACNGTPSAFAQRFLKEVAHAGAPRVHCNAIVMLAPSREGLDVAMERVADVMAWQKVKEELQQQDSVDPARMSTLGTYMNAASGKLGEAIRQAWCIAVTLNANGAPQAFKLNLGSGSPFSAIKNDSRSRVQASAINAEALLPDGPYALWGQDDEFRSVRDILGTFTKRPNMPKMLSLDPVLDTLKDGCLKGTFVLRLPRPDGSARTWWKSVPDQTSLKDPAMEIWLPEKARLESMDVSLILPSSTSSLWPDGAEEITVGEIFEYFSGNKVVVEHMDGDYDEEQPVPAASTEAIYEAVRKAVKNGQLWLLNVTSSVLEEEIPTGVLTENARLRRPPADISGFSLAPEHMPAAWHENMSNIKAIADVLSQQKGVPLPWVTIKKAVNAAISARCIEIDPAGGKWPCDYSSASSVLVRVPTSISGVTSSDIHVSSEDAERIVDFSATPMAIFDLGDITPKVLEWQGRHDVKVHINISVTLGEGAEKLSSEDKDELKALFSQISEDGIN